MATTGYPAELTHDPSGDDHDDAATFEFRGVRVTITLRSHEMNLEKGTHDGTVLVFVDTEFEETTRLSIQINDDPTWEGEIHA